MIRILYFLFILLSLAVSACSTQTPPGADRTALATEPLLPLPAEIIRQEAGEDDGIFAEAVAAYIKSKDAPSNTMYEFTRIDLNGDGQREGIAMLKSPNQYWCNVNGCTVVVFEATDEKFKLKSEISSVRGPLIVSHARSNGWNDLIVRVSGRSKQDAKDVALHFDGRRYPQQPTSQPPLKFASSVIEGVRIFP